MRTSQLDRPDQWRAWNGAGFSVRFVDPYRESAASPAKHVCEPVSFREIGVMTGSLTVNTYLDRYVVVSISAGRGSVDTSRGIYYSTSEDLISWKPRRLMREVEVPATHQCNDTWPVIGQWLLRR
jgi:hypothetical protein